MLNPAQFIQKWTRADLPERAASQEHFIDLCRLLGQPTPAEHDSTGAEYAFEKGVEVSGAASKGSKGSHGFADVWWKGKFGWEYKRKEKYKSLDEAYRQLLQYREALESPPLLIVSDIARTEIHTNFTGTRKETHSIRLADMDQPEALALFRRVFTDPESFRPAITAEKITQDVAADLGKVAEGLRSRGHDPHDTAHFLMKCMFCLFAEDVRLLPFGLFKTLLEKYHRRPADLRARMADLLAAMRTGGAYGNDDIAFFNGGLFDDKPPLELTEAEIGLLNLAAAQDWGSVEPAIFGTLFERSLDPAKRSQIGAHYTSRDDIMLVIGPVIVDPLRREWESAQASVQKELDRRRSARTPKTKKLADEAIEAALQGFVHRLSSVTVLDPACGSGNFLYVAIQQLLDLEKEVITFAARPEIALGLFPRVRPTQLRGIEINPYAAELAQVVIWIGYLQWMRDNGFKAPDNPILSPLTTIENRDAIIRTDGEGRAVAKAAEWPDADFIVGNPPFLGTKMLRRGLGDGYVEALFTAYEGRIPAFSDLVCYWFELARSAVEKSDSVRVGLLATQAIRNDHARVVLERIKRTGDILFAYSDREWVLEGAAVNVSIVGFGADSPGVRRLDGAIVPAINADLTTGVDLTTFQRLRENLDVGFVGDVKGGPFDVPHSTARSLCSEPTPNGESPLNVVRPYTNGLDVTRRNRAVWVIDFGADMSKEHAASYGAAFEHVATHVKPARESGRPTRKEWWIHMRPCGSMRNAVEPLHRYVATPTLTKYRLFAWMSGRTLPDHQLIVFGRSDDYFFGVLHSAVHELWALRMGTQLEDRPRYTPTTCFETFPLPWPPGQEPAASGHPQHALWQAVSDAARDLNTQRERWLNPPEWLDPVAARIDAADDFADVPQAARPLIRHSAIMEAAAKDPRLKKRTLTNLYNERPTWLRLAHERLDRAVLAAYAAVDPDGGWDPEWASVWTDSGAGQPLPDGHPLAERRKEVDQQVLAALLRLNLARASA